MVQRTVLKVDISCLKCKKKLLKAVSTLQGVDKIEVDVTKGTLTVTGDADPYEIIVRTRKAGSRYAEVVSVGPPPAPPKQDGQKKPEAKKPEENKPAPVTQFHTPHNCPICSRMNMVYVGHCDEPNTACSIM